MTQLEKYDKLSKISDKKAAWIAVDICGDEVLSEEEFDIFYSKCKKLHINLINDSLRAFRVLVNMLSDDQLATLNSLI